VRENPGDVVSILKLVRQGPGDDYGVRGSGSHKITDNTTLSASVTDSDNYSIGAGAKQKVGDKTKLFEDLSLTLAGVVDENGGFDTRLASNEPVAGPERGERVALAPRQARRRHAPSAPPGPLGAGRLVDLDEQIVARR